MVFKISRWFVYAPVAIMPLVAAAMIGGKIMQADLQNRAAAALASQGAGWASLTFDGRDARIGGQAPDEAAKNAAVAALGGVWGVRTVTANIGTSPALPGVSDTP